MFSSFAARVPTTLGHAARRAPLRLSTQVRLASRLVVDGSKGRAMPLKNTRATAAASGMDATFTIRVCWTHPACLVRPCLLTLPLSLTI